MSLDELKEKELEAKILLLEEQRKKTVLEEEKLTHDIADSRINVELLEIDARNLRASHDEERIYTFYSDVTSGTVKECIKELSRWSRRDPGQDLRIVFNSPGGSVVDGFALYDFIQELKIKGHYIETVAIGWAASMGGVLLQAGDHRVLGKNAFMLIHEVSALGVGKLSDMEDEVKFMKRLQERILLILAERSTYSKHQISAKWKRKDWWLDSEECLKFKFVDEVR